MKAKVNLKMLSELLGLSQTTVSRALNGYSDVSEATRKRVVEAADRLGYQPNPQARQLATGQANAVGVVYPFGANDLSDIRFMEVVSGMTERLAARNLDLLIHSSRPDAELDTYRRLIDGKRVDALIVARTRVGDPRIRFLQERDFPFVAYGRTQSRIPYAWFDFDNEAGGRLAVEHLVGLGHRRIALISAPQELNFAMQRRAGFVAALRDAGIEPDPTLLVETSFSRSGGYDGIIRLLGLPRPPTALLVDNNIAGIGVLRALADRGWKPGDAPSLIIYDGIPGDIPLPFEVTAIVQPGDDSTGHAQSTGHILADLVVDVLAGKPVEDLHRLGRPTLAAGDTDAPALAARRGRRADAG